MAFPVDVDGTWVNGPTFDAAELRRADAAMFASAGIASGLGVTVDGSDVVTVAAGQVVISGEDAVTGTGVYRAGIGAAVTGALTARNATNGRIDLVVFRQLDSDVVGTHTGKTARIEVIAGTPSATPAVPAKPSMAVELARITVPASGGGAASVNSTNRTYASAVSAPLSGWTNLPLASGWTARAGYYVPAYRLLPNDRVELRGAADGPAASGPSPFLTLPAAIRPAASMSLPVGTSRAVTSSSPVGRLDISAIGGNQFWSDGNSATWFCLDGVTYSKI